MMDWFYQELVTLIALLVLYKRFNITKCRSRLWMPILGICLGLEMLFNKSEEGILDGLKVLNGDVLMLPKTKVKVPHIGWNNLRIVKTECNLLKGIPQDSWVYFVHSYHIEPQDENLIAAITDYGSTLPVVIERSNLFGVPNSTLKNPEKLEPKL